MAAGLRERSASDSPGIAPYSVRLTLTMLFHTGADPAPADFASAGFRPILATVESLWSQSLAADRSDGLSGLRALNTDSDRRRSPCSKVVRPFRRLEPLPALISGLMRVVAALPFELFDAAVPLFIKTEP